MSRSLSQTTLSTWRLSTQILLPVGLTVLLAIGLTVFGLFWTARQSNEVSVQRQIRAARHAINTSLKELARQQQTIAAWDRAVEEFQKSAPDWSWVDDEIGVWLYKMFGRNQVYILNARNEPVYAMVEGARAPARTFLELQQELSILVDEARNDKPSRPQEHETVTPFFAKDVRPARLVAIEGRPAAARAAKFVPLTSAVVQEPGSEFIIIGVHFLDANFLANLAQGSLFDRPRFTQAAAASASEVVLPLRNDRGEHIGYFMWEPELPGTRILRVLGPIATLVIGIVVAVMGLLARSLQRSMFELQASQTYAQHLASHDGLTGLPNRTLFAERLDQALAQHDPSGNMSVLMLDLERFKQVNDTLGPLAGDILIRDVAGRLSGLLRSTDTVARVGGDEFAILQTGIHGKSDIESLCERIMRAMKQPFEILGNQVFVGISIGAALASEANADRADLMRKANIALYSAKEQGFDCFRFFDPSLDETVQFRSKIEDELRTALMLENGLRVFYQPLVSSRDQSIIGLEALVRWQHPAMGLISPGQFIPIAEKTGLIVPLGEWVLLRACSTALRWPNLFVAVNLSSIQLRTHGFAEKVMGIVRDCQADPRQIELEITESSLLEDDPLARSTLKALRGFGFRIALDDFGTGYSSLSYLHRFEIDKLKIDRSFVQHLGHASNLGSSAIISAVVALGRTLKLTVVAEGVETEEQSRLLIQMGCDELQGYLFSRPLPEENLTALLGASSDDHQPGSTDTSMRGKEQGQASESTSDSS